MDDLKVRRGHIEALILNTYIYAHNTNPLDEMELYENNIDYTLFKSCRTFKLVAKAIYKLHSENKPFDMDEIINFISNYEEINFTEFLDILAQTPVSYETMIRYVERLKLMDREEEKEKLLRMVL